MSINVINNYNIAGFEVTEYQEVDSTMSIARENHRHNTVVSARIQSSGRGRYGRNWQAGEGNLMFSLMLKQRKNIDVASQLSFVSAVAMGKAIRDKASDMGMNTSKFTVKHKWPNDIIINGKKTAGILLESFPDVNDKGTLAVIIGIGANIQHFPTETTYPATSLENEGLTGLTPSELLKQFLNNFAELYSSWETFGFSPIRNAWLQHGYRIGEEINIRLEKESFSGIFEDLDNEGNLIVKMANGSKRVVASGEVF